MYFSVLFTTGIKTPSKGVSILSILSWQRYHGLRVCSLADEERDDLGAALDQVPEVVEVLPGAAHLTPAIEVLNSLKDLPKVNQHSQNRRYFFNRFEVFTARIKNIFWI